jgi:uncharacterized protein (DUF2336 family)
MNAIAPAELIAELEAAARDCTPERGIRMLRCTTELYLKAAARLSPSHVDVFDGILMRLMERMEARALVELSAALANVTPAPPATVGRLARHENPTVAAPVLLKSPALTNSDLVEISSRRSQQHLVAIASRSSLDEAVTDAVLRYAGKDASRAVVKNPAARFTAQGYAALLATAERDDNVAESLGSRPDLPEEMLHSLLSRASETVRARLSKATSPQVRERIQAALASGPSQADAGAKKATSNDYAEAKAAVVVLNKGGKLSDSSVNRFAMRREYPNVIAALTLLSGADLEVIAQLMEEESGSGLIIACRGSRLNWQTTQAILNNRRVPPPPQPQLDELRDVFELLYVSAAQYTIRFEPPVNAAAKSGSNSMTIAAAGGQR